jgi:uncharacterized protein (DUF697 family)
MIQQGARLFSFGRYFWDAVRETNPNEVRAELERPITVAFFGRPGSGRHTLAKALFGTDEGGRPGHGITFNEIDAAAVAASGTPDLAFLVLDATVPDWSDERRVASQLASLGCPLFLVLTHADKLTSPDQGMPALRMQFPSHPPELTATVDPRNEVETRRRLQNRVLQAAPAIRLALAHRFPALRSAIAELLIRDTSRVNAQVALISSLPTLIPVLGFLVGGMADILILTKNQAMLVFKLAAIHGLDLDDKIGILKEIAPVIGSAFIWRTVARTAVGLAPAPISALPKTAIGYLGTYVVGKTAQYYYEHGDKPPPEVLKQFRADALKRYSAINDLFKERLGGKPKSPPPPTTDNTADGTTGAS